MAFKYACDIDSIEDCPPDNTVSEEREAYRFVKSPLDANSFLPVAKINPARRLNGTASCMGLGLSLYNSKEAAERKRAQILKIHPKFCKRVGEDIAVGLVSPQHGVCSPLSTEGHFTLFEYENVTLESSFLICEEEQAEANG